MSQSVSSYDARVRLVSQRFCHSEFSAAEQEARSDLPPAEACSDDDRTNLATARQVANSIVGGLLDGYAAPRNLTAERFFADVTVDVHCVTATHAPVPKFEYTLPLRVRGSVDGLNIARGDPAMPGVAAAALSYAEDEIKDKTTTKASIVVGWPIPLPAAAGAEWELVPYTGINRDVSRVDGMAPSVTSDTYQLGVALNATRRTWLAGVGAVGHRMTLRPDFMRNDDQNSEIASVAASWMPVINGQLNDFIALDRPQDPRVLWKPVLDFRTVYGEFTDIGKRDPVESQDFFRLGGQVGVSVVSVTPRWPFQLTATETYLPAIRGFDDLEYREIRASLWLDPEKIFSIELTYGEGRRTDAEPESDGWKLSLGAKY